MAKQVLQDFLIKLGFQVDKSELENLHKGVGQVAKSAHKLDQNAENASRTLSSRLGPAIGALLNPITAVTAAITLAYKETFEFIHSSAEAFDEVGKLGNRVNATAKSILQLSYVAEVTGSSMDAAKRSLDGFNQSIGEASLGVGRAKIIFKEIGLSIKDSNGNLKDTGRLMLELGQKIKGMERGKQLAILEKMRIDPTMIETLTRDVGKLGAEFSDVYKKAGINADEAAKSAQNFNDSLFKLKFVIKTIKDSVAISFFKEFTKGFQVFRKQLVDNLPKIIAMIKPVVKLLVGFAVVFIRLGSDLFDVLGKALSILEKVNKATHGWGLRILAITVAWKKLNLAMLASPIGIIIGLGLALLLLYDDYKTWERGGKSFIDWGKDANKWMALIVKALPKVAAGIIGIKLAAVGLNAVLDMNPALRVLLLVVATVTLLVDRIKDLKKAFASAGDDVGGFMNKIGKLTSMPGFALSGQLAEKFGIIKKKKDQKANLSLDNDSQTMQQSFVKNLGIPAIAAKSPPQGQKNITLNQKTEVVVQGSSNPYETANAVGNQQKQINAIQVRNLQGAAR